MNGEKAEMQTQGERDRTTKRTEKKRAQRQSGCERECRDDRETERTHTHTQRSHCIASLLKRGV